MSTMASSAFHGSRVVVVALHARGFPSDGEWEDYLDVVRQVMQEGHGGPAGTMCGLAITDGGAPTSRQRALLVDVLQGERAIGSVVTTSRLARGVGHALSWIHPEIKSFAPRDFARALRHLSLPEEEWPALGEHLRVQGARIHVDTLDEIQVQRHAAAK